MVKVISLPYIFQVLYVLCFTWPRHIAGERLQDHWSSGYKLAMTCLNCSFIKKKRRTLFRY